MVVIPKPLYKQICRHAEESYPEECCGLLLGERAGSVKSVRTVLATENDAEALRHKRYRIPPKALLDAENRVKEKGWEVLGAYHSHPDHAPHPSEYDRERAILNFEYIIVEVRKGRAEEAGCWILGDSDSGFAREDLLIPD